MKNPALILSALLLVASLLRAADPSPLRVLAYDRTIPASLSADFTRNTGIQVEITGASSSIEAADLLYDKKEAFDLLIVSNDVLRAIRDRGELLPLNRESISNASKIRQPWFEASGDPAGKFSLPIDVAAMGILVDLRVSQPEVTGYMDAFRQQRPGGVAVMVDQRDFLAAALLSLGASVNELSPDNLRAARVIVVNWLKNIAPASKGIWSDNQPQTFQTLCKGLESDMYGAALIYSGDAIALMSALPDRFKWVNPVEGSLKYMTVAAIPKGSVQPDAAYKFIDFLLKPQNASQIVVAPGFGISSDAPLKGIPLNFQGNPGNIEASQLMDVFSVQMDITREPREELEEFFRSLPDPSAPPVESK